MKRFYLTIIPVLIVLLPSFGQEINKTQLALDIADVNQANTKALMEYIWKREMLVYSGDEVKLTLLTELSVNDEGKLESRVIEAKSDVKKKRGIRGKVQSNAMDAKTDYIEKGVKLLLAYGYMSKGNLVDFFDKAEISSSNDLISMVANNVYVEKDKVTLTVNKNTHLYTKKEFSSFIGEDPVSGVIYYETFKNGVSHVSNMVLNMPSEKMKLDATNKDYTVRVR